MTGNRTLNLTKIMWVGALAVSACGSTTKSAETDTGFDLGLDETEATDDDAQDMDDRM